ncbi:DUF1622 domain-containing protein [Pseudanabaena sp. PCC 6802]|uniref:DUF1622 domain-containing protein n=1 Tax=Pseudanabaena sp. PCC 6802 TaxID=118173 RepID=UPI00034C150F|nr:DUF1622 domain-containing protein [Pseudanabaena sp. PCC 6802]
MEYLEKSLYALAAFLKLILEGISVLCILLGLLQVLQQVLMSTRRSHRLTSSIVFTDFRIRFGAWLLLALEFQLAADIVNTTVAPSFEALGKLGTIAVIRTFLNYFLNRELAETLQSKKLLNAGSDARDRE